MRLLLALIFGSLIQPARADDAFVPEYVFGYFKKSFTVRDYGPGCQRKPNSDCFYKVEDKVIITRRSDASAHVKIEIFGDNGHLCYFSGDGKWINEQLLLADRLAEDQEQCRVLISFRNGQISRLASEPDETCKLFCGARAVLQSNDLRRVEK